MNSKLCRIELASNSVARMRFCGLALPAGCPLSSATIFRNSICSEQVGRQNAISINKEGSSDYGHNYGTLEANPLQPDKKGKTILATI